MCGIAGVLRPPDAAELDDRTVVQGMLDRLERRGPDDQGVEVSGRLTLGNRRLSVLDLSANAHQPMATPGGRWLISFNGEIYNYDDIRHELGLAEADLRSTSDTEVLLHAWGRWGPGALDRLVGQFAFAAWDRERSELWVVRDRFGEKPLFYHLDQGTLTFASSLGALVQAPWVPRRLDRSALAEFVTLRYLVAPRTVLESVEKLPAGHLLRAGPEETEVRCWYDPRFRPSPKKRRRDDTVEEFGSLLAQASKRCTVSDVPLALLLSDGIDSNSIRWALADQGIDLTCLTFRITDDRSPLGEIAAPKGSKPVVEIVAEPGERIDQMVDAFSSFTEPVGDGAALASWLLVRQARERATVFLCGHGGDEILGGYRLSQDRARLAAIHRLSWLPASLGHGVFERYLPGPESPEAKRRSLRQAPSRCAPTVARYLMHRPVPPEDVRVLLGREDVDYLATVDRLYAETSSEATDLDQIQEVLFRTFLTENILSWGDSIAMDASAELRMPFLDRDLVDFVLSLPLSWRVSRCPGWANTKLILRAWGGRHLPKEIVARKKRGFNFGNLSPMLAEHGDAVRDFILGSEAVRRALPGIHEWLGHAPDFYRQGREGTLWALLCLAIWCEAQGIN